MAHTDTRADIQQILNAADTSTESKIEKLKGMWSERRAQMRAATEGPMVADDDVGADIKLLEQGLEQLHASPSSMEDGGASTL